MSTQASIDNLVRIPQKVLDGESRDCGKLTSLSAEMITMVVSCGILGAIDIACLRLTCKYLAKASVWNLRSHAAPDLRTARSTKGYKHGAQDEMQELHKLLHRLDVGWNRSNTKICYSCCVFRSLDPLYWATREETNGRSRLWRVQSSRQSSSMRLRDFIRPWLEDHRQQLSLNTMYVQLYNVQIEINEAGYLFLLCPECVPLSFRFSNYRKLKLPALRGALGYT